MVQAKRIERIINEIMKLPCMGALDRKDFAEEGGYADAIVLSFGEDDKGKVNKEKIKDALKSTQLRKFFHTLKQVQMKVRRTGRFERTDLLRITPELAYATGRGLLPRDFYTLLKICMAPEKVKNVEDFLMFFDFVEAILAYYKYRSEVGWQRKEENQ